VFKDIIPNYRKSIKKVFIDTAKYIIRGPRDLYVRGSKSLYARRTVDLPSWIPEWTGPNCEDAIAYLPGEFCKILRGYYSVEGRSLFVDDRLASSFGVDR
jgi:hypothetical protein